jgi:hypothetical protein
LVYRFIYPSVAQFLVGEGRPPSQQLPPDFREKAVEALWPALNGAPRPSEMMHSDGAVMEQLLQRVREASQWQARAKEAADRAGAAEV